MPSDARADRAAQPSPGSTASAGRPTARPDEGRLPRPLRYSFILLLALATVALSGFHFGPDDNSFHIAIVLDYMSLPQFRDDETIQSLRAFIAPLYHLLRLVADATTVETWFLALFLVTRLATVAAFLALVERLSSAGPVSLLAATAGVFLASMPYGSSQVGWTGLMVRHFSHSELAQACALWALVAMGDRKAVRAGALVGLTAFFNLFVGIWLLLPWAVMFIRIARQGAVNAAAIRGAGASMLLALLGAAPPVLMHLVTRRPHEPFDYREFIVTFYYHHFMLGKELEPGHILFVCLLAAGLLCMVAMRQRARAALLAVLLPLLAVFAIGIVVGWTTNSLMLFNLHLLRVDGLIVWVLLAAVAAGMAACLADGRGPAIAAACLVVVALMRPWQPWLLLASGVATAVALRLDALRALPRALSSRASPLVAAAVFLAVLAAAHLRDWHYPGGPGPLAQGATPTHAHFLGARPAAPEWHELQAWVRTHTSPYDTFLVPLRLRGFSVATQRRIWVDLTTGARVLWAPWTYRSWRSRYDEVLAIRSLQGWIDYAAIKGIDFAIVDKRRFPLTASEPLTAPIVHENRWFAIADTRRLPAQAGCPAS